MLYNVLNVTAFRIPSCTAVCALARDAPSRSAYSQAGSGLRKSSVTLARSLSMPNNLNGCVVPRTFLPGLNLHIHKTLSYRLLSFGEKETLQRRLRRLAGHKVTQNDFMRQALRRCLGLERAYSSFIKSRLCAKVSIFFSSNCLPNRTVPRFLNQQTRRDGARAYEFLPVMGRHKGVEKHGKAGTNITEPTSMYASLPHLRTVSVLGDISVSTHNKITIRRRCTLLNKTSSGIHFPSNNWLNGLTVQRIKPKIHRMRNVFCSISHETELAAVVTWRSSKSSGSCQIVKHLECFGIDIIDLSRIISLNSDTSRRRKFIFRYVPLSQHHGINSLLKAENAQIKHLASHLNKPDANLPWYSILIAAYFGLNEAISKALQRAVLIPVNDALSEVRITPQLFNILDVNPKRRMYSEPDSLLNTFPSNVRITPSCRSKTSDPNDWKSLSLECEPSNPSSSTIWNHLPVRFSELDPTLKYTTCEVFFSIIAPSEATYNAPLHVMVVVRIQ